MPDEFDPTVDLGLPPDRYAIFTNWGFISRNNDMRELCADFLEDGAHFFDVLDRYDKLTSFVLNREDATLGCAWKWSIPFLKAAGATDYQIHKNSIKNLQLMPNIENTVRYTSNLMPTYISTETYEHGMMDVMDRLGEPQCEVNCSGLCIDQCMMGRLESRKLLEAAKEICSLKVPKKFYELNQLTELMNEDIMIIKTMDRILSQVIPDAGAMVLMEATDTLTSHKKAYKMLDIRRMTAIDLVSTMYVGSSSTDFQAMDLVRDGGGLAISFNGEEFAVRGSNVAILSEDTTVVAIFASEFMDKGPIRAMEVAENWSREYLESEDFVDRNLIRRFLEMHPYDLPEVYFVDDDNVDFVSKRSDEFRKRIIC